VIATAAVSWARQTSFAAGFGIFGFGCTLRLLDGDLTLINLSIAVGTFFIGAKIGALVDRRCDGLPADPQREPAR